MITNYIFISIAALFVIWVLKDFFQKENTIKRNFPVFGNLRFLFIALGPAIRQYFIASNRDELPFNRSQRNWIDSSSKKENNYEGFGTDKDLYHPGHIFVNPKMFPFKVDTDHINHENNDPYFIPCAKVIGLKHERKHPFRPYSIVNISAMSYGSLSKNAQTALNIGASMVGCYHNTGEGGLSPYHMKGADVMFHIGTGYFGCGKDGDDGKRYFDFDTFKTLVLDNYPGKVKAIEIKLSQGAKPGKGGVLPAKKNTKEIAAIRGVKPGVDVLSPTYHTAFNNVPEMVDFIEDLATKSGLPVGIKSAVGDLKHWEELADIMKNEKRGPDFITIDGGEGGTGAAPPSFADHVALPWVFGFSEVYNVFKDRGLSQDIAFGGSGKLGFPSEVLKAFAMGVDFINIAREAMLSIGCIQAQECHTGHCPTGIATQSAWLQRGLDPSIKAIRFGNYINTLRKETLQMTHACGYEHPSQMQMADVDISCGDNNKVITLENAYNYKKEPVHFESMQKLFECNYLGGLGQAKNKLNKKK
ncbi:MAG: FMN-binding glutamate synthase family protein [Bacteroidetes bacterium]|nr:FMN-binding glutamate synthase family protein [Bacteroidota bacterium]MDA0860429.1 FMN-binding glutamate synthase family protein [Bacteroidota bacterium]MDA1318641.1 FMN-binding glutamate synthase family protein [Bacteroidota bacterium]